MDVSNLQNHLMIWITNHQ